MKKFLSFLLTFVMLFSLTMPAMAAEPTITGGNEGEVSATFDPDIKITGMVYTGDEAIYNAETNTYTVLVEPTSVNNKTLEIKFVGENLEYYADTYPDETMLMVKEVSKTFGECVYPLYDCVYEGYYSWGYYSRVNGNWWKIQYSNDGGQTWSDEVVTVEVRHGYDIVVNESQNGIVTVDRTYMGDGMTVDLDVAPADGYMLDTLTVTDASGAAVTVENNAFTMPASAVMVNATFKLAPVTYKVTVNESENGAVTVDPDKYTEGETVTLNIVPTGKYTLASLIVSDGTNEIQTTKVDDETYTFVMPAADVTVTATFEDVSAKITGVALTVDGVTYTGADGEGYVFINPNSDITVSITGVNLNNMTEDNVISGMLLWIDGTADWVVNADGTEASVASPASDWKDEHWEMCSNGNLVYTNDNSDWTLPLVDTGIKPIYLDNAGTDLTTIYFNNTNAWETITATFYTVGDPYDFEDNYPCGTAQLSLVGGESVIYSTTNIPNNAAYVTFSNGTETTDMVAIPMASANTAQYNMDGTWSEFIPTPPPVTSAEITWGSMSFTYDDTVDAATGEEKGWGVTNAADAQVTVKNTGETVFVAEAGYTSYEGYVSITGSFTPASSELAIGNEYTFTLELDGKPKKALSGDKIGKVTVTITKVEESE